MRAAIFDEPHRVESALVKLYADEDGAEEARRWSGAIVMSALSMSEVLAAMWGKASRGVSAPQVGVLDRAFAADLRRGPFEVLPVAQELIIRSLQCVRRHRLRGAHAVQLASARLRAAASAEGFALLPAS